MANDAPNGVIECHLSRANPHWKDLAAGGEALMIFHGPDAYVTPIWYPSKAEHGKVVPTWNYAVVHAYGRPEVMQDMDWLRRHVGELSAQQEAGEARPWAVSDAPDRYVSDVAWDVGSLAVTRLEGKRKMSQTADAGPRGVMSGLGRREGGQPPRGRRPRLPSYHLSIFREVAPISGLPRSPLTRLRRL